MTTGTKFDEFSENFQTASDPPPTLFSKNYVALFATTFFGVQQPHPFSLPKKRMKFFGSEMTLPPLRKFSENSSNLVQLYVPKFHTSDLEGLKALPGLARFPNCLPVASGLLGNLTSPGLDVASIGIPLLLHLPRDLDVPGEQVSLKLNPHFMSGIC